MLYFAPMNNESIHALIFDMDGTMIDNMAVHNRIWLEFLAEMGGQPDPLTFNDRTAGMTNPEIVRMFLGADYSEEEARRIAEEKEVRYRSRFKDEVSPMPGLLDLMQAARQAGIKLAVATAAPPGNVHFVLGTLGLENYFDAVVNGAEVVKGKPDPEIFLKTAEKVGAEPCACLVFEDSRFGLEAARRAGMRSVMMTTSIPAAQAEEIPGVWKAIADFREITLEEIAGESENGRSRQAAGGR